MANYWSDDLQNSSEYAHLNSKTIYSELKRSVSISSSVNNVAFGSIHWVVDDKVNGLRVWEHNQAQMVVISQSNPDLDVLKNALSKTSCYHGLISRSCLSPLSVRLLTNQNRLTIINRFWHLVASSCDLIRMNVWVRRWSNQKGCATSVILN